ncbi:hypothetical protein K0U73_17575, partial [bacterium]|nr:hypothetical protein [bacterium]
MGWPPNRQGELHSTASVHEPDRRLSVANEPAEHGFTHLDEHGAARMVDVTPKEWTKRVGVARARVSMSAATATAIQQGVVGKGDVLAVARIAG